MNMCVMGYEYVYNILYTSKVINREGESKTFYVSISIFHNEYYCMHNYCKYVDSKMPR